MATSFFDVTAREQQVGMRAPFRPLSRRRVEAWARQHVLGEALFHDALVRERKRADRLGSPFAVLLVGGSNGSSQASSWVSIQRALPGVKRDIDVVGWLKQGAALGLLLPQMPATGAVKIMRRLQSEIANPFGGTVPCAPSMRLYMHGEQSGSEGADLPTVDQLIDTFVDQRGHPWRDAAKRGLDILASAALLAFIAPVLAAIFIAVRWTSPGPALFRQVRIGRNARPFTMLKFRTMHVNAGHGIHQDYVSWFIKSSGKQPHTGNEVFKLTNDPRVTRVGRLLRKSSLDELPQLWNVLRGDMSLVGPRPPLPFEVAQYQPWHLRRVLEAKPGVTGLWQVNGRSRTTFDEMVRLDLRYARAHSFWTDIRILAATPRAMVSGKGAC